ncbi:hypothetical protein AKJ16_DCAP26954 [Drosera capensis]
MAATSSLSSSFLLQTPQPRIAATHRTALLRNPATITTPNLTASCLLHATGVVVSYLQRVVVFGFIQSWVVGGDHGIRRWMAAGVGGDWRDDGFNNCCGCCMTSGN